MPKISSKKKSKTKIPSQKSKETVQRQKDSDSLKKIEKVRSIFSENHVLTEDSDLAREFYNKSRYGSLKDDNKLTLSFLEALYLKEKGRLLILNKRNQEISTDLFIKKAQKSEKNFWVRYCVFKDLRNRGYIVKTALKFGADFRVYDRGIKPGEDHAKWIVYPVYETSGLTWHEFSAKNRVAHSTRKRLLIGIVDEESDVTYYEIRWTKP